VSDDRGVADDCGIADDRALLFPVLIAAAVPVFFPGACGTGGAPRDSPVSCFSEMVRVHPNSLNSVVPLPMVYFTSATHGCIQ
jgi:hypothetical protein